MPRVDPNDPRPPYHQIADDVRQQIASGALSEGDKLPSIRELATAYGVAPMTVHQAVRVLRDERLLVSYQGRGIFVDSAAQPRVDASLVAQPFDQQTAAHLAGIQGRLDAIENRLNDDEPKRNDLANLQQDVADLRAHLIDLYARTGHRYPHPGQTQQARPAPPRRKASGG
jgi:DNA-binding GntR family transcriptional regulator